jgi:hypothetical protein
MNHQVVPWLTLVNGTIRGTTNEIPFEHLKWESLKSSSNIPPYQVRRKEVRKVARDAYISFRGNRYSVPYQYAGKSVTLDIRGDSMVIRLESEMIDSHRIVPAVPE